MRLGHAGSTALEFAVIAPVFLLLTGAIIDFGRFNWMQMAMQYGVEKAARCTAVNANLCATPAPTGGYTPVDYAFANTYASGLAATDFTYTQSTCGHQVAATKAFTFLMGFNNYPVTLRAMACFPS